MLTGCDYAGSYTFNVNNELSDKTIEIRFKKPIRETDESGEVSYKTSVSVAPGELETIIIIYAPINSPAHDCLNEHGITYFEELVFDAYIDGVKLNKQLWQGQYWEYKKISKWLAEYTMTVTEDMIPSVSN